MVGIVGRRILLEINRDEVNLASFSDGENFKHLDKSESYASRRDARDFK